jgi:hypothetical protein
VTPTHAGELAEAMSAGTGEPAEACSVADPKACPLPPPYTASDARDRDPCFVQRVHIRRRVPGVQASEHRASCQTGAWVARCRCRCRSPAPTCRCQPGAHCCVFATSRRTLANPAASTAGRDRHLIRHGSDWRGLIRATTEAVPPAPDFAPLGCPCFAPPFPERPNRLPGRSVRGAVPSREQALCSVPHRGVGAVLRAEAHRIGSGPSACSGFPAWRLRCIGAFRADHTPRGASRSHSALPPTLCRAR